MCCAVGVGAGSPPKCTVFTSTLGSGSGVAVTKGADPPSCPQCWEVLARLPRQVCRQRPAGFVLSDRGSGLCHDAGSAGLGGWEEAGLLGLPGVGLTGTLSQSAGQRDRKASLTPVHVDLDCWQL